MQIEMDSLAARDIYGLMIQTIIPRPIAWVLSDNGNNSLNLAPFSYFNGVSSTPPILSLSIGRKRDGSRKDTWRNIEERGHCVVHIASVNQASEVSSTSAALEFGDSEVVRNNIPLAPEPGWPLPRLQDARVAFLCQRYRIIEVGEGPQGLILGQITRVFLDDTIARRSDNGIHVAPEALDPLARLGGNDYTTLGRTFTIERP